MAKYRSANCMGYALQKDDWMLLDAWRRFIGDVDDVEPFSDDDRLIPREETEADAIAEMEGFGLKSVERHEMRPGIEYVALKFSLDDFHFMRRNTHGHWRHKPGFGKVRGIKEKDVFKSKWKGTIVYNSRTLLFEVWVSMLFSLIEEDSPLRLGALVMWKG